MPIAVLRGDGSMALIGRCYRSQRRNEIPYKLRVDVQDNPLTIINASCDCAIGLSQACGHIAGLLYTFSNYQMLGMDMIPTDVACTSQPRTWHAPRGPKIAGKDIQEVTVHSYSKKNEQESETIPRAISSTLYNPLQTDPPPPEDYYEDVHAAFPECMALSFMRPNTTPLVSTKFGYFPKGSFLSHQQKLSGNSLINLYDVTGFPGLPCRDCMINNYPLENLSVEKQLSFEALKVTHKESAYFEEKTRLQSETKVWYDTRKNRITASNFGQIVNRKKQDVTKLIERLKSTRYVQTEAMKAGLAKEPEAAARFCTLRDNKVNIYPCGCVVSCTAPWFAASPDKKIYDPNRQDPFGLLEIKCPECSTVSEHKCLEKIGDSSYQLKRNHNYFYQVLCQLAVTGLPWCDFFIWCSADDSIHCETIYFEEFREKWQTAKDKVDTFYFEHFL